MGQCINCAHCKLLLSLQSEQTGYKLQIEANSNLFLSLADIFRYAASEIFDIIFRLFGVADAAH